MKAIVLTYDRNRSITDHMMHIYNEIWPDHPFHFRIPYQDLFEQNTSKSTYIQTPKSIKLTVLKLIEDLPDDEWIYWCIDDKFLLDINLSAVKECLEWIPTIEDEDISSILFCRCRRLLLQEFLTDAKILDPYGNIYLERKHYHLIWIHQFLRVKVLRYLFHQMPDNLPRAKEMDPLKDRVPKPPSHRLFVSEINHAVFAESSSKGIITKMCYKSMDQHNIQIPGWVDRVDIVKRIMGELNPQVGQDKL